MVLKKKRIVVLASGSGSNCQVIIDSINKGVINGTVVAIISNRKDAYVLERARKAGIVDIYIGKGNYPVKSNREKVMLEELEMLKPDLILLAGYLEIIPEKIISVYKNRIMNIHPALIPSFCGDGFYGMNVHKAVIDYGVKLTGATVHFVDEGTDTGPVILQKSVSVSYSDTPEIVQRKVLEIEHQLLPTAVQLFCDGRINVVGRKVEVGGSLND